ncbi:hypothetical protein DFH06DRAFT_1009929, partial [Mycena polygramma]
MSIHTLCARVNELNVERARQMRVLTRLDISRGVAQRQLEAALKTATYPRISTLPPETMSQIFSHCIPPLASSECSAPPMLLLHVCRKWRVIAATTPSLW